MAVALLASSSALALALAAERAGQPDVRWLDQDPVMRHLMGDVAYARRPQDAMRANGRALVNRIFSPIGVEWV